LFLGLGVLDVLDSVVVVLVVVWVGEVGCWERAVDSVAAVLWVLKHPRSPMLVGPCEHHSAQVEVVVVEQESVVVSHSACEKEAYRVPGLVAAVAYVQLVEVYHWAGEEALYSERVMCEQMVHRLVWLARQCEVL
jgi:hypothetical protein